MSYAKICPRRGTKSEWEMINPVLMEGELGIESPNTGVGSGLSRFKIGDGHTDWQNLPYAFDANSATAFDGGTVSIFNTLQVRRGTTDEWEIMDPVLSDGEVVLDTTKMAIKVGDGEHTFKSLEYIGATWEMEKEYDFGDIDDGEIVPGPDDKDYDFGDLDR